MYREMLKNAKKTEDQMKEDIKSLNVKVENLEKEASDQLNSFNSKLEQKEVLLDKQINLLKTTTEDLAKAKGALVTSKEFLRMKEDKLVKLEKNFEDLNSKNDENLNTIKSLEENNRKLQNENIKINDELQTSQKELTTNNSKISEKDEEIGRLKTLVDKDESELKVILYFYTVYYTIITIPGKDWCLQ